MEWDAANGSSRSSGANAANQSSSPPSPGAASHRTLRMATTRRTSPRSWRTASAISPPAVLDLVQLHCPPTDVYYRPEVFGALDRLVEAGKIRYYGVSVERVEEALKAIEYPGVASVQIIFNGFRHRPAELFFEQARKRQVGILARVPLASGLLTGKLTRDSQFAADDHRNFNRHGESFDVGETFSGVDYSTALEAIEELRPLAPERASLAQFALRWILEFDAVTCAIPGGKRPDQVADNCAASDLPPLSEATMRAVSAIYDARIRPGVHQRW